MSASYISFCRSKQFGEAVLKIGFPHPDLFSEMEALQIYGGGRVVKLLDFNKDLAALLLERIEPGDDLTSIKARKKRIEIASEISAALPVFPRLEGKIPLLQDIAEKAFFNLRKEGLAAEKVQRLVNSAWKWLGKFSGSMPEVLLHGDLNHWNILKDKVGWRAIDPKGYRGPACMEAGRFMINELAMTPIPDKESCLEEMVEVFARGFGQNKIVISRAAFIDKALSLTWKFEDNDRGDLSADVFDLELLGKFCRTKEEG